MKKIIPVLAICLLLLLAGCDEPVESAPTAPVAADTCSDQSATTDAGTGQIVTAAAAADDPVAGANNIDGWGYINTNGEWVIAPQYMTVYPFVDNVATVQLETGEWQLIDKSNNVIAKFDPGIEVVEPLSPATYPLPNRVSSGCTIFDGMIIIAKDDNGNNIITRGDDLFGYADTAGNIVVEPQYREVNAFGEGLAGVNTGEASAQSDTWAFIDKTGAIAIEPGFYYVSTFSEGLCQAQTWGEPGDGGCIDRNGDFVISYYSYIYPNGDFKDGVAPARLRYGFGVIGLTGTIVGEVPGSENRHMLSNYCPFASTDSFNDGLYPLYDLSLPNTEDGMWPQGFIDSTGNFAIPAQTEWKVCQGFYDGMCCVYTGESAYDMNIKYGYIDKTGAVVIPIQYYKANMFNFGYAAVATGDMSDFAYSIIDKTGNIIAEIEDVWDVLPFTK